MKQHARRNSVVCTIRHCCHVWLVAENTNCTSSNLSCKLMGENRTTSFGTTRIATSKYNTALSLAKIVPSQSLQPGACLTSIKGQAWTSSVLRLWTPGATRNVQSFRRVCTRVKFMITRMRSGQDRVARGSPHFSPFSFAPRFLRMQPPHVTDCHKC
jgi:hypothetical protein